MLHAKHPGRQHGSDRQQPTHSHFAVLDTSLRNIKQARVLPSSLAAQIASTRRKWRSQRKRPQSLEKSGMEVLSGVGRGHGEKVTSEKLVLLRRRRSDKERLARPRHR